MKKSDRIYQVLLSLILGVLTFLITACAVQPTTTTTSSAGDSMPARIRISLGHSPTGMAELTWSSMSHDLTVTITATGLTHDSTHLVHIHAGNCAAMGKIVYMLNPLVANAGGVGTSKTTIPRVMSGIPPSGWGINIHNGSTLATALGARPLTCGNISPPQRVTDGTQSARAILAASMSPDENVHGMAQFRIVDHTVIVTLSLSGMIPNTTHMAHIHSGSCESQGPILYPLNPITADSSGNAMKETTIQVTTPVPAHWYINVHEAGTMAALKKPLGFTPIACGNGASFF